MFKHATICRFTGGLHTLPLFVPTRPTQVHSIGLVPPQAGGPLVESTRQMPSLVGPLQGIMAAVIGVIVHLAGVFARQTWLPGGWHMLPDLAAVALTLLATWLLIQRQMGVASVLGVCTALGLMRLFFT
jgi:chromate transporter